MKVHVFLLFILLFPILISAATGCDLNDPDADIKRLFPQSTGYKTAYLSLQKTGGSDALKRVEKSLGDKLSGTYETIDVPYSVYTVFKGKDVLGYVHGVNQKGQYGGLQVFLALDNRGVISNFYLQKLSSKDAKYFKDKKFTSQFKGLALVDFSTYNLATGKGSSKLNAIKDPATSPKSDFAAIMRAVKKNLSLMQEFVFKK
ncbi:MAG: hypothetical protein CVU50_03575 [Candidatus Cloacimonetes bacterium HGW-Cloacimonetes-3]|jgi:hypothetical protein|nr:MAG: hypothetical protein CVU50_03575 [Candidatus Cloacimonetes bacterium HGW-Cloacimonetes-3]